jgi:GNAT superfamily N-acetyltransferase
MISEPIPVVQVSHEEQRQALKNHFALYYQLLAKSGFHLHSSYETEEGVERARSGIPFSSHNAVLNYPKENSNWDECIHKQLQFFQVAKTPFVWYIDEGVDSSLQEKLRSHGFQDGGVYQGMIGYLTSPLPLPGIPDGWSLDLVKNESDMDAFQEIISKAFSFDKKVSDLYRKAMWMGAESDSPKMYHWIARHDGKPVSILTTMIVGEEVSFWNAASLPEYRRQGFSSALRRFALRDAFSRGCRVGMSYLFSDHLALGICRQLGYEIRWRFRIFISPQS